MVAAVRADCTLVRRSVDDAVHRQESLVNRPLPLPLKQQELSTSRSDMSILCISMRSLDRLTRGLLACQALAASTYYRGPRLQTHHEGVCRCGIPMA